MKPIRTPACNLTFVGAGCEDLPAARGHGFVSTYWKPDAEDMAALNAGLPVKISWMGSECIPISVEVEAL